MMRLRVFVPDEVLLDAEAARVVAEAENGHFCMLPRHVDFLAALVPGLLVYTDRDGEERFVAVSDGVLVKCGADVMVSVRDAVEGADLGFLRETIDLKYKDLDDRERRARSAVARLDAALARKFIEFGEPGP